MWSAMPMKKNHLSGGAFVTVLFVIVCTPWNDALSEADPGGVKESPAKDMNLLQLGEAVRWDTSKVNEVMSWLHVAPWKDNEFIARPSNAIVEHLDLYKKPESEPISFLSEARQLGLKGDHVKAAQTLIQSAFRNRTLLSFQSQHMDTVAFPLVRALLESGERQVALQLLSACTVMSGDPVGYFRACLLRFTPEEIAFLWQEEDPFVVLVDFGGAEDAFLSVLVDRQKRDKMQADIEYAGVSGGEDCLRVTLSGSKYDDLLILGRQEYFMALTAGEAGLRARVRTENPQPLEFVVQVLGKLWSNEPFQWLLRVPEPKADENGWLCFDTASVQKDLLGALFQQYGWARSFTMHFAEPEALSKAQLTIAGMGIDIPPGSENTVWLDRIELYLPRGSWLHEAKAPSAAEFGDFWLTPGPVRAKTEDAGGKEEALEALRAMGYLGAVTASHSANGVTIYDPNRASPGVNFLVSGHAPELILTDMEGKPLHTWRCNFESPDWPESELPASFMKSSFWRRAHLYPDGEVLAVLDYIVLTKMDKDGKVIWVKPGGYHHNMDVGDDGTIHVLYAEKQHHPETGLGHEPLVDYIMALDPQGRELWRVSLIKALENSYYAPVLHSLNFAGDVLHTNSIKVLDGVLAQRIPAFKRGNIMVCMHQPSLIAVIDPEQEAVVWALGDQWLYPHEPVVLSGGTMLIFDNHGPQWHYMNRLASRILEFDPVTREVLWEYTGTRQQPFHSYFCGSVAQLPNNNLLISETSGGRAFEVTREKEIVWEYYNPFRGGENGEHIAVIFEIIRFPESYVASWLLSG